MYYQVFLWCAVISFVVCGAFCLLKKDVTLLAWVIAFVGSALYMYVHLQSPETVATFGDAARKGSFYINVIIGLIAWAISCAATGWACDKFRR
jgi:hypothetical protein